MIRLHICAVCSGHNVPKFIQTCRFFLWSCSDRFLHVTSNQAIATAVAKLIIAGLQELKWNLAGKEMSHGKQRYFDSAKYRQKFEKIEYCLKFDFSRISKAQTHLAHLVQTQFILVQVRQHLHLATQSTVLYILTVETGLSKTLLKIYFLSFLKYLKWSKCIELLRLNKSGISWLHFNCILIEKPRMSQETQQTKTNQ